MSLSQRQRNELELSILNYLKFNNLNKSFETLSLELNISDVDSSGNNDSYRGLLEKKWTSIIRLQRKVLDLEQQLQQLKFNSSPSSSSKNNFKLFLPNSPSKHNLNSHRNSINSVCFHPLYTLLASSSDDCSIKIWDWDSGDLERTLKGHTKQVLDVDFNHDGSILASASSDTTIKLWDSNHDFSNIKTLYGHDHSVSCIKFYHPSNSLISASRDNSIKFWDLNSGYCTKTLHPHSNWIKCISISQDNSLIASTSSDKSTIVMNLHNDDVQNELFGHDHVIESVAWAPLSAISSIHQLCQLSFNSDNNDVNRFIATASRDKLIKLWDLSNNVCIFTFEGHHSWVKSIIFHPSGSHLLSCSDDKSIKIWDLKSGRCVRTIDNAHNGFVNKLCWGKQMMPVNSNSNTHINNRRFSLPHPNSRSMSSSDILNVNNNRQHQHQQQQQQQQPTSSSRPLNVIASAGSDMTVKVSIVYIFF